MAKFRKIKVTAAQGSQMMPFLIWGNASFCRHDGRNYIVLKVLLKDAR